MKMMILIKKKRKSEIKLNVIDNGKKNYKYKKNKIKIYVDNY